MYAELLQNIGLSPNEAKIYETLLNIGVTGVGDISTDHTQIIWSNLG